VNLDVVQDLTLAVLLGLNMVDLEHHMSRLKISPCAINRRIEVPHDLRMRIESPALQQEIADLLNDA
jgi:hypothetical protein